MNRTVGQAARFGLVGLMNTAITYLSSHALLYWLHAGKAPSNAIAYVLGLINSFVWNKLWTFRSKGFRFVELALFLGVFGVCWLAQWGAYDLMQKAGLHERAAFALGMVVYTGLNFLGNKFITFGRKDTDHEARQEA